MKKVLLAIFVAVVAVFTVIGVYYVAAPVNTEELSYETIKHSISAKQAYIVREEEVYYADMNGTLYSNAEEGERIAANSLLATVYNSDVSADLLKALNTVDKKIQSRLDDNEQSTLFYADESDLENKVAAAVEAIGDAASENDIPKISEYKEIINNLRAGNEINEDDKLGELYAEKESIEQKINSPKSEIRTGISGVFTTYIDGLEGFLDAESIKSYTPGYISEIPNASNERLTNQTVSQGAPVCKVVNNHVWYLLMVLPKEDVEKCKASGGIRIRLSGISGSEIKGEIYSVSEEENGLCAVSIRAYSYLEGAFSYRVTEAELILESYSGYKVPVHAIRTDDNNKKYVLCRDGSKEYKCYCTIEYTNADEEFVIINSSEDSENKLEMMERIVLGEK